MKKANLKHLIEALIDGDEVQLVEWVNSAVAQGIPAPEILNDGLIAGMALVGEKMESEEMFVPEVLMAAKAMKAGVRILNPQLAAEGSQARGRVVIGTVKGDMHDIGKNLVAMMIESGGLEVFDVGVDVAPSTFVAAVNEKNAGLLCLSALLTTTMPMMKKTIEALVAGGIRKKVKILVGGAPVTASYAAEIGADGYAPDAGAAVRKAKALIQ